MLAPERRTRGDLAAAAVIVVALLVAGSALWLGSDARGTVSQPAADDGAPLAPAKAVPTSLTEVWRAPSPASGEPVLVGSSIATGEAGTVTGRDPLTGAVRWTYRRDLPLCTLASGFGRAVAVYRRGEWCSEVTSLEADGRRGPQRNAAVAAPTRLVDEGTHVVATGKRYAEAWRADMVMTLQYGEVPAPVNPGKQPRQGCTFGSFAAGGARIGVIERCPNEATARLTLQPASPKEAEEPQPEFSTRLPSRNAQIVAVSRGRAAVLLPDPARLAVYDDTGTRIAEYPVPVPPAQVTGDPPGRAATLARTLPALLWFTGTSTVALDPAELRPLWTMPGTLGAGALLAGQLLVPVPEGLAVVDPASGARTALLPVDRGTHRGPVQVAALGPMVFEQRGAVVVALR